MITLERPLVAVPSPDGTRIAYIIGKANFRDNYHEHLCHIYEMQTSSTYQLTHSGEVSNLVWYDNNTIALLKSDPTGSEEEKKKQIHIYQHLRGDPIKITSHKSGVLDFKIHAGGFLYQANDTQPSEKRKEKFGAYTHVESEDSASRLYYINLNKKLEYINQSKLETNKEDSKLADPVLNLSHYYDFKKRIIGYHAKDDTIWINFQTRDDLFYLFDTSCYRLLLNVDEALVEKITTKPDKDDEDDDKPETFGKYTFDEVELPAGATIRDLSPDGSQVLVSYRIADNLMYIQEDLAIFDVASFEASPQEDVELNRISQNFDHSPMTVRWTKDGIFVHHIDVSDARITKIYPNGEVEQIDIEGYHPLYTFHVSDEGTMAFPAGKPDRANEVVVVQKDTNGLKSTQITDLSANIQDWQIGKVESIRWTSKDGTEIEGVLRKPPNFDPTKKYPLAFVVHGGPSWYSGNVLLDIYDYLYYPSIQFSNKDILVLKPNYRGSIGRGQEFLELNKNNLGIGDLWDLHGAIDYLSSQGWVDKDRIGCMGWSQGGYISAFVSTHSERVKAVSIGAGVSSWYTYHITNDIRQFTTHYLSGSPFENPDIYDTTAPISKISASSAPALIQHGENDQRVPLANALEMHRAYKDLGVATELFVFDGMPHGITKPLQNRAVMHQNLTWFLHYLLDEAFDFEGL